ncbi:Uncharacterised protein [Nocardia otitidiscaviarum]|uniref:DUF8176 domain-containing protein n=1 Tax=Nocardia otitidiscaviarum TaxID=1823 RepID=A0A379JMK0_9NOCA|nr:hypothetical protein [Nocardia otitidiscaviarum]SUD49574.1 Uncharacterised protein [Nocardia otitidiscaviarum]
MSRADRQQTGPRPAGLLDWFDASAATGRPENESLLVTAPKPRKQWTAPTTAGPRSRGRRSGLVVVACAVAALAVGAWAVIGDDRDGVPATVAETQPPASSASAPPVAPVTASSDDPAICGPASEPGLVRGKGPGGTDTGPNVILAFEYHYYVDRDAVRARELVTDDSSVPSADRIQSGIDTIPSGTAHCITVRTEEPERFLVGITEVRPDGTQPLYTQRVSTTTRDGRVFITAITPA